MSVFVLGAAVLLARSGQAAAIQIGSQVTVTGGELPDIDSDSSGGLHLAFRRSDGAYYARLRSSGWSSPAKVPGSSGAGSAGRWNPPRVTGNSSEATVLWGESSHANNRLHVHRYNGSSWSEQTITGWIEYCDLETDTRGYTHVVYVEIEPSGGLYHYAYQQGQPVVSKRRIAEGAYKFPDLDAGPGGKIEMACRFQVLHSATMSSSFQWTDLETCSDVGGQGGSDPSVVVGPGSSVHTAWIAWNSNGGDWYPDRVFWMDGCGHKEALSTGPLSISGPAEVTLRQSLAVDSSGNRLVVWPDDTANGRLHYNYYSAAEAAWSGDRLMPVDQGAHTPLVEAFSDGRFHLVWQTDGGEIRYAEVWETGAPPPPPPPPPDPGFILAGFWSTSDLGPEGGLITLLCLVDGGARGEVAQVELLLAGVSTGIYLARSADGLYGLIWTDLPGLPEPGEHVPLGLRALDAAGAEILRWPELRSP